MQRPFPGELDRVVVVGSSCSGKTTFARQLSQLLQTGHIELDALHWKADWEPRATAVAWLNYPFWRVFSRALWRTVRRVSTREELYSGNRETFRRAFLSRDSILVWVISSHWRRRRELRRLEETRCYPQVKFFEFRRPAQASLFLSQLGAGTRRQEEAGDGGDYGSV